MRCHGFLLPTFLVLMVGCKEVGEVDDEGCERLSVHDGLLDVAWFLCVQVGWFVGGG